MDGTAIEVTDLRKKLTDDRLGAARRRAAPSPRAEIFGIAGRDGAGKTTTVERVRRRGCGPSTPGGPRVCGLDPVRDRAALRPLLGAQLQTSALPDRLRVWAEALRLFAGLAGDVVDWRSLAATWGGTGCCARRSGR